MVADAVKAQADLDIDRRRVEIENPLIPLASTPLLCLFYRDIKANLALLVGDEATFAAPAEEAAEEAVEAEESTEEAAGSFLCPLKGHPKGWPFFVSR